MIAFILTNWRLIGVGLLAAAIALVGYKTASWRCAARKADGLEAALNQQLQNQKRTHSVGMDLEHGNNLYRLKTRALDKEIYNAPLTPVFEPDSLRRRNARNAAGIASRQRTD